MSQEQLGGTEDGKISKELKVYLDRLITYGNQSRESPENSQENREDISQVPENNNEIQSYPFLINKSEINRKNSKYIF